MQAQVQLPRGLDYPFEVLIQKTKMQLDKKQVRLAELVRDIASAVEVRDRFEADYAQRFGLAAKKNKRATILFRTEAPCFLRLTCAT